MDTEPASTHRSNDPKFEGLSTFLENRLFKGTTFTQSECKALSILYGVSIGQTYHCGESRGDFTMKCSCHPYPEDQRNKKSTTKKTPPKSPKKSSPQIHYGCQAQLVFRQVGEDSYLFDIESSRFKHNHATLLCNIRFNTPDNIKSHVKAEMALGRYKDAKTCVEHVLNKFPEDIRKEEEIKQRTLLNTFTEADFQFCLNEMFKPGVKSISNLFKDLRKSFLKDTRLRQEVLLEILDNQEKYNLHAEYKTKVVKNKVHLVRAVFVFDEQIELAQKYGQTLFVDTTFQKMDNPLYKNVFICVMDENNHTIPVCAAIITRKRTIDYNFVCNFLRDMSHCVPETIVTDGEDAMINALHEAFPTAQMRRCIFHLVRNTVTNVSSEVEDCAHVIRLLFKAKNAQSENDYNKHYNAMEGHVSAQIEKKVFDDYVRLHKMSKDTREKLKNVVIDKTQSAAPDIQDKVNQIMEIVNSKKNSSTALKHVRSLNENRSTWANFTITGFCYSDSTSRSESLHAKMKRDLGCNSTVEDFVLFVKRVIEENARMTSSQQWNVVMKAMSSSASISQKEGGIFANFTAEYSTFFVRMLQEDFTLACKNYVPSIVSDVDGVQVYAVERDMDLVPLNSAVKDSAHDQHGEVHNQHLIEEVVKVLAQVEPTTFISVHYVQISENAVTCSCKHGVAKGTICRHALCVLHLVRKKHLIQFNIHPRWKRRDILSQESGQVDTVSGETQETQLEPEVTRDDLVVLLPQLERDLLQLPEKGIRVRHFHSMLGDVATELHTSVTNGVMVESTLTTQRKNKSATKTTGKKEEKKEAALRKRHFGTDVPSGGLKTGQMSAARKTVSNSRSTAEINRLFVYPPLRKMLMTEEMRLSSKTLFSHMYNKVTSERIHDAFYLVQQDMMTVCSTHGRVKLEKDQLLSIQPNQYVCSAVMNFMIGTIPPELLQNAFVFDTSFSDNLLKLSQFVESRQRTITFHNVMSSLFMASEQICMKNIDKQFDERDILLFPINHAQHWLLIMYVKESNCIHVLNSLVRYKCDITHHLRALSMVVMQCRQQRRMPCVEPRVMPVTCLQQVHCDCGFFMLFNIMKCLKLLHAKLLNTLTSSTNFFTELQQDEVPPHLYRAFTAAELFLRSGQRGYVSTPPPIRHFLQLKKHKIEEVFTSEYFDNGLNWFKYMAYHWSVGLKIIDMDELRAGDRSHASLDVLIVVGRDGECLFCDKKNELAVFWSSLDETNEVMSILGPRDKILTRNRQTCNDEGRRVETLHLIACLIYSKFQERDCSPFSLVETKDYLMKLINNKIMVLEVDSQPDSTV